MERGSSDATHPVSATHKLSRNEAILDKHLNNLLGWIVTKKVLAEIN
jgi:hypothetical protein